MLTRSLRQIHNLGAALTRAFDNRVDPAPSATNPARAIPATVEYRGSGTMSSPCPPRTNECTFSTLTLHSIATNALMRAEVQHAGHSQHA